MNEQRRAEEIRNKWASNAAPSKCMPVLRSYSIHTFVHLTPSPPITYNVFGGTLSLTQSIIDTLDLDL